MGPASCLLSQYVTMLFDQTPQLKVKQSQHTMSQQLSAELMKFLRHNYLGLYSHINIQASMVRSDIYIECIPELNWCQM